MHTIQLSLISYFPFPISHFHFPFPISSFCLASAASASLPCPTPLSLSLTCFHSLPHYHHHYHSRPAPLVLFWVSFCFSFYWTLFGPSFQLPLSDFGVSLFVVLAGFHWPCVFQLALTSIDLSFDLSLSSLDLSSTFVFRFDPF